MGICYRDAGDDERFIAATEELIARMIKSRGALDAEDAYLLEALAESWESRGDVEKAEAYRVRLEKIRGRGEE